MNRELREALSSDLEEYKSIPFWSWNNSLDEEELVRQIAEMKEAGTGGFIMHARTGLRDEYLGEKWFSCVGACLKKARELGMKAWIYDENGWPSGFAGGKLLENEAFRARFLEYEAGDFDPDAFAVFEADSEKGYVRIGENPGGGILCHNIYLRVSPANSDILNPAAVDAFIAETHEKYYERFPESFGRELAGFFTDEPQYYRLNTPYAPSAAEAFAKEGEDIRDGLIWLFKKDERGYPYRLKYYGTLNRLYTEVYYKRIYDWCGAHGCMLTGHSIEETGLFLQMWGGAAVMPTYEFEDIPAVDWLGRDCGSELSPKQVGSAASQTGKKRVLTETFACSGYDVTSRELKSVGEYLYFNGVNMMCQHLYPYSLAGQGKTDHPPVFSPQGNWFDGFRIFNRYFDRLGYIVANTDEVADIAVLHPEREIWLDYIRSGDYESVRETEDAFAALLRDLRVHGVTYQFIDERILARHGKCEGSALRVGARSYGRVLVPAMRNLSPETYEILREFRGGLCMLGRPRYIGGVPAEVSLAPNLTLEEIYRDTRVKYACPDGNSFLTEREGPCGSFLFVKNLSSFSASRFSIQGLGKAYRRLDLAALEETDTADDTELGPGESRIFLRETPAGHVPAARTEEVTGAFSVAGISENFLVLDRGRLSREDGPFGAERPLQGLFETLLREDYRGRIRVRQRFVLTESMPLTLMMERADYRVVLVNGERITLRRGDFDVNFLEAPFYGRAGENELEYALDFWEHDGVHFALFDPMATESLRNCLYYDTSLENAYIRGRFTVGADLSLAPEKNLPPLCGDLYKNGYPFFYGELRLKGTLRRPEGEKCRLILNGRYAEAVVRTERGTAYAVLDGAADVSGILGKGENETEILLRSSPRNLFGPLHFREREPRAVSPYHFTFRGAWPADGGTPADWTDAYQSVPFGLESILLESESRGGKDA